MSFSKVSQHSMIAVSILSLLFIVSCGKDDSKKDDPKKTETIADSTDKKSKVDTKDIALMPKPWQIMNGKKLR